MAEEHEIDIVEMFGPHMMRDLESVWRAHKELSESVTQAYKPFSLFIEQQAEMQKRIAEALAPMTRAAEEIARATQPFIDDWVRMQETIQNISLPVVPTISTVLTPYRVEEPIEYIPRPTGPMVVRLDDHSVDMIVQKAVLLLLSEKQPKRTNTSYPLPKGAVWGKLKFKFIDGHTVSVKYPNLAAETFDFKDLGCLDHRKNNADIKWEFLRALARHGGSITNSEFDSRFNRTTKYETAKRLTAFFGMSESPFDDYKKAYGYRLKFAIFSDSDPVLEDDE